MDADDRALARHVVRAAGAAIVALGREGRHAGTKGHPTDVVTAADHAAEAAALALLEREAPDDGVLAEEGTARPSRSGRTWVLDPLDGTLNYARGLPGWCVAAALLDADGAALACAVWDPVREELFSASAGGGADVGGRPLAVRDAPLRAATVATFADRARRPATAALAAALAAEAGTLRMTGCGTLELAWVADARLDAWVQPDVAPWDWHPGALLVREAGGRAAAHGTVCIAAAEGLHDALAGMLRERRIVEG